MSDKLKQIINKQQEAQNNSLIKAEEVVQLVGFIIGDEEYAVPILSIQEIIKPFPWTRVPQVPKHVVGVFNMRGAVIPLIDLRLKFGISAKKQSDETRFIVMRDGDEVAGFIIDRLTMAIRIKKSNIGPAPESMHGEDTMIDGVGKQEDRLISILKVKKLLARDF
ncbi:chemotaxis protein CheW [Sulfurimonas sp.]|uniref:chemotaxis protein CheW n=1 Tax=Sulfurimonas sp. TaxID=2022749 RepID=UPI0025FAD554|nr:chemotaxis protein CheW [Sulfurimonas sp.]MDD5158243.1 chemotaxis protein CheW [Sulfurimonas sp.]